MKRAKNILLLLVLASGSAIVWTQTALSFPQYTQQTGQPCSYCHVNPAGGAELTAAGMYYAQHRTLEGFTPPPAEAPPEEVPPPAPAPPEEVPPVPPAPEVAPPAPPPAVEEAPPAMPAEVGAAEEPVEAPPTDMERLPVTGGNKASLLALGFGTATVGTVLYRRRKRAP